MVRVFVPLSSRHCKYASLAPSGGSGMSVEKGFCFPKVCRKGASCAGWRRRRKSGNAYLLQKDSVSLHTFSCQIEKKRCFQQSVFPLSGRFSGSLRSFIFFLAEKKSVSCAKRFSLSYKVWLKHRLKDARMKVHPVNDYL